MLGLMLLAAGFMHDLEGVQVAPRCLGELVQLETSTGVLFGTIDLPTTPSPWPIVLIHPGSGPTDRDGNQANLKNNSLKMLGRELASRGFATLRIDKRGIAASVKALSKETDIVPDIYCSDVAAWVEMLRRDPRFTKIAFIGHSEGSLLGLAATKKVKLDAFVSLCGPGRPLGKIILEQLEKAPRAQLPENLLDSSRKILAELEAGRTVSDVPVSLNSLFRSSVQPYLIASFRYDPVELAKSFRAPLLVVTGSTDIQVSEEDGIRLSKARPGIHHQRINKMNHVLKLVAVNDRIVQIPAYIDPTLPLHPELVPAIAEFLRKALVKSE